jgi:hypothetical protein
MNSYNVENLRFYDGRTHAIDKNRIYEFETQAVTNRYYSGRDINVTTVVEELGPFCVLYSNVQPWSEEIPDIDKKSARLFTLWAEDKETRDIVSIIQGFYIVVPFQWGKSTAKDYYLFSENVPYYPIAVVSSFLTILNEKQQIIELLAQVKKEIQKNWLELRQKIIESLDKTDLWKRYVLAFEKIIHFSLLCSSFDRELIEALRAEDYRLTGVLQMFASPTASDDQAMIESHLTGAKKIIEEVRTIHKPKR